MFVLKSKVTSSLQNPYQEDLQQSVHGQEPGRDDAHAGKLHELAQAMIFHVVLFRAVVTIAAPCAELFLCRAINLEGCF